MKKLVYTIAIALGVSFAADAQPSQGNPGGAPTPIGGVALLVAAGAALGGKKAYDAYKNKEE